MHIMNNHVFYNAGKSGEGISVTVGVNVKKIPAYLFCPSANNIDKTIMPKIINIEFQESSMCESIGGYAFQNCISLESLEIPANVISIGNNAFQGCTELTRLRYDATECADFTLSEDENYRFMEAGKNGGGITVTIGANVKRVPAALFKGYYIKIVSIIFEENSVCESIGEQAFISLSWLTSMVVIPDSVSTIENDAFCNCGSLTSIVIGDSTTTIGKEAFINCSGLTSVYYKGEECDWSEISIDSGNSQLVKATRYYYSETQPTEEGNYWYYDENGEVAVW